MGSSVALHIYDTVGATAAPTLPHPASPRRATGDGGDNGIKKMSEGCQPAKDITAITRPSEFAK